MTFATFLIHPLAPDYKEDILADLRSRSEGDCLSLQFFGARGVNNKSRINSTTPMLMAASATLKTKK